MLLTSATTEPGEELVALVETETKGKKTQGKSGVEPTGKRKIWIDLDNSPHVPFFLPIIEELRKRGYPVLLTARDSYQVRDLLEFHKLQCKVIGKHYGKFRLFKAAGTFFRVLQLLPWMFREKPDLGVSLGSRAQIIACLILRIPTILAFDYEHSSKTGFFHPNWVFIPAVVSESMVPLKKDRIMKYPGLKEDVYVPKFHPDPSVLKVLGIGDQELVVTLRPPATEAHYHNPESETLFEAALEFLIHEPEVRVVLLPRNDRQAVTLRDRWPEAIASRKIVIPGQVVNGLSLIWYSDLVISGGGTMNREAAALGVPVYSIFRGKIGAVDRYLAGQGRMVLLEKVEDIKGRIALIRRDKSSQPHSSDNGVLNSIVEGVVGVVEHQRLPVQQ